jgi:crotonobetainyl-CoA:carnitine CoA-transferase CaiB-like acyl-CoA transferase
LVEGPLTGLRILDLTRFVAGPHVTSLLAALGADVIKVEVPSGDPYRAQGTERIDGQSVLFLSLNSGKRSVAIDFRSPLCADAMERLLASSDFLIENSRPGALDRYGLDWPSVHFRHPALVYGSISGYGDVGPDAAKGGFDVILQAESGVMSVTGTTESGPVKVGAPLLDVGAGLSCAMGLLSAHIERLRTGVGRHVSSSLLEFAMAGLSTVAASYFVSGHEPGLLGTHSPTFAPYGGFRTRDGWLIMAGAGSEDMWQRCCRTLDLDALVGNPMFIDNASRVQHRDELTARIEEVLITQTSSYWLERLQQAGIPAAEVQGLGRVLSGAQVEALGSIQSLVHDKAGPYRVIGAPFRLDGAVPEYPRPSPDLGADTRAVLSDVGLTPDEIDGLVEAGVAVTAR